MIKFHQNFTKTKTLKISSTNLPKIHLKSKILAKTMAPKKCSGSTLTSKAFAIHCNKKLINCSQATRFIIYKFVTKITKFPFHQKSNFTLNLLQPLSVVIVTGQPDCAPRFDITFWLHKILLLLSMTRLTT